ncbi:reverse transcriptase domain-containing protein, partial [Tanacetum coccineum]
MESGGEQGDKNGDNYEGRNGGGNGNGGNGNGGRNGNGNDNRNGNGNIGGNVVGLTRWFEKMETVFHISNCLQMYHVKYATCTLLSSALTWWNSHKRAIRFEAAYAMKWTELLKLMTEVYCPRNEIQKMETELWNLTVKENDLTAYTRRFQELVLLCTRMVPDEEDKVEIFIGGLPNNIQGNVIAAEPTRLQDAIRVANNLMDHKLKGYARNAKNKRSNERKGYVGSLPYYNKCKLHHEGPCTMRCGNFKKSEQWEQDWKQGWNKTRSNEATTKAYAIRGGANLNSNVVIGTFLLNNCYASMLFDSGVDRSFVSSTFSALLDVSLSTLDTSYDVEIADGRISETNIILRGCTLGLLVHPFDIDLMPIELGSFDVIIGMD